VFSLPPISSKHCVERKYPSGAPETQPKTTIQSRTYNEEMLIRNIGIENHLRVSIGTPEENDAFLEASKEVPR
jgi:histidinol-phosphate/aromatic aminotransferase/cobyric acid decarboxylase-like protein